MLNFGHMESCIAHADTAYFHQRSKDWWRKKSFTCCQYPTSWWRQHFAVHDMESLRNNMIIIGQYSFCETRKRTNSDLSCKDFRNKTLTANRKWQLGGRKISADTWTNSYWRTSPTRLQEENAKDTRTTGSWLSTSRDRSHGWTKGRLFGGRENPSRICDNKLNNQVIVRFCRVTKLDKGHSKNVIEQTDTGSGKDGKIHFPLLHQHGQDRNPGGPPQSE